MHCDHRYRSSIQNMIWEYEITPVCVRIEDIRNRKGILIMKKEVLDYVVEKTHDMMEAFSCSAEAKAAGQAWLDAVGTENEAKETEKYIAELEADFMPLDNLIAFAESEGGAKVFGAEKTKEVAAHAKELKAAGAKYCDCPACAAVEAILAKKAEMLEA